MTSGVDIDNHPETVKAFMKPLDILRVTRGYDAFRIALGVLKGFLEAATKGEQVYMDAIKGLSKDELDLCAEMLGILLDHFVIKGRYCDVLGPVYMEVRSNWKGSALGQFFTPWSLCLLNAKLIIGDNYKPGMTVHDPCVGSASMLLAARAHVAQEAGREMASRMRCSGQDIDPLCCDMAWIQLQMTDDRWMSSALTVLGARALDVANAH